MQQTSQQRRTDAPARPPWTEAMIADVRRYHAAGMTFGQITERLGNVVSRNAVIGKAHRLGLGKRRAGYAPGGPSPQRRNHDDDSFSAMATRRRRDRQRLSAADKISALTGLRDRGPPRTPSPLPVARESDVARVAFADLEPHHCRWPVDLPEPVASISFGFCGAVVACGSYCRDHAMRSIMPAPPRRRILPIVAQEALP